MQYVERYMELYPEDRVTIIGGRAAYLHLSECGINASLKDVNVETDADGRTILDRFLSIVPPSYTAKFDVNYPISIFTLLDESGEDIPVDVFVNQEYIHDTKRIGAFRVERLDTLINKYYRELLGRKMDVELIQSGVIDWNREEIPLLIDKYNRLLNRLQLLVECYRRTSTNR